MKSALKISICAAIFINLPLFANEDKVLPEVKVVSATGFEQNIKDAPATLSVITKEALEKKNHKDIESMTKDIPSLFGTTPEAANRRGISIRGFSPRFTKILVNGMPVPGDNAYKGLRSVGGSYSFIPPASAISRIEVIRGPMSSLYGSDALGGVINIITDEFSNEFGANLGSSYKFARNKNISGELYNSLYLHSGLIDDVLSVSVYGKNLNKSEDKISYANREQKDRNFGAKLFLKPNENNDLTLELARSDVKYKRTKGKTLSTGTNSVASERIKGDVINLSHEARLDNILLQSYLSYGKLKETAQQNLTLKTLNFDTKGSYFTDNNAFTLGINAKREKLDEKATTADAANVKRYDYSVYAEDDYRLIKDFILSTGIRYNYDENYGSHVSPRIYGIYNLNDFFALKGGVSTGYATPDIKQRTQDLALPFAGGRGAQLGRSSLKPETSVSYEFGGVYNNNEGFETSLTGFYTSFKDMLSYRPICSRGSVCRHKGKIYPNGIWESINIGKAEIYGVELTNEWQVTNALRLNQSYVYTKSKQKDGSEVGKSLNNYPLHTFKFGANYELNRWLNFWSQINYYGRTKNSFSYADDMRAYVIADLGINYNVTKNFSLNLSVYNLFNEFFTTRSGRYDVLIVDGQKIELGFNLKF
ncbi:TonB-dependent receptor [Campylobacter concisus]|uniref:TonB-dependent receptor domain-containing protein n=1 Tax=Campylobacter concisus TaxID=199 RepID=UPI0018AC52C1|nr:TonB-dependent receptor [Campylobacter concisus]QPH99740.1 TonB-dependent receptor [Campylobacter concisus]QPI01533.1 TonB-dependent receptor [Campylobacter concisus]